MNNKGFGIIHVLLFCVLVFGGIYVFFVVFGSIMGFSNKGYKNYKNVYKKYLTTSAIVVPNYRKVSKTYEDMELDLANSGKKYIEVMDEEIKENQSAYISLDLL